jgi:hypothetical protein
MRAVLASVGCVLAFCLASASASARSRQSQTYTDDDLRRVSSRRAETGVESEPASPSVPRAGAPHGKPEERKRGEDYWRAEAERFGERIRSLRLRAAELRVQIEQQERRQRERSATARRRATTTAVDATTGLKQRLYAVETEIREREAQFEERARREGALPGWLR